MTFNEYIDQLVTLAELYPEIGTMPVIYAVDPEGNAYHQVYQEPTPCKADTENYFIEEVEFLDDEIKDIKECNAVCIN